MISVPQSREDLCGCISRMNIYIILILSIKKLRYFSIERIVYCVVACSIACLNSSIRDLFYRY